MYDDKNGGFKDESENLQDTGYWAQFELFVQGRKNKNCVKTPLTCALIEAIPEVKNNRRGQVKFSVMKSGTHVHAHSGPTNCRLRAHLGKYTVFENQPKMSHFMFFKFWHFSPIFVLFKVACLVTLFYRKLKVFKNSSKWTIFGFFNELL